MKRNFPLIALILFIVLSLGRSRAQNTFALLGNASIIRTFPNNIWPGDYNADGFADFIGLNTETTYAPTIYQNLGGTGFLRDLRPPPFFLNNTFRACWGDPNGDGLLDFLAATPNDFGEITTALHTQTAEHTFIQRRLAIPGAPVCWADIDNDGLLDIVTYNDEPFYNVRLFWANPNGSYSLARQFDITWNVQIADIDKDGDLDLLFDMGRETRVFRNEGHRVLENLGDILPAGMVVDLNGDGRLDLLGKVAGPIGYTGFNDVRLNQGGFNFLRTPVNIGDRPYAVIDAVDFDGDSIPELVAGGGFDQAVAAAILKWSNTAYTATTYTISGSPYWIGANIADFDNDGDPDILGNDGISNRLYFNRLAVSPLPPPPALLPARVTRDRVFFNWIPGSALPATFNLRVGTQPGLGDINSSNSRSDGRRLLRAMGNTQTSTRWHIDGLKPGVYYWSAQSVDWSFRGSQFAPEMSFTVTGAEEIEPVPTISSPTTNISAFEDTPLQVPILFGPASIADTLTVSMTGGDPSLAQVELVGTGANRTLSVRPAPSRAGSTQVRLRAASETSFVTWLTVNIAVHPVNDPPTLSAIPNMLAYPGDPTLTVPIVVADPENSPSIRMSATSSDERILPSSAINPTLSAVAINFAAARPGTTVVTITAQDEAIAVSQTFTLTILNRPFLLAAGPQINDVSPVVWADFNNDGWMDLATPTGILINEPTGWQNRFQLFPGDGHITVADFDGDNYLDILNMSSRPQIAWSQGGVSFVVVPPTGLQPIAPRRTAAADLDRDGDTDLILSNHAATLIYLNTGRSFVESATSLPGFVGEFSLADLNNDGILDFAFGGLRPDQSEISGVFTGIGDGTFVSNATASSSLPRGFKGIVDLDGNGLLEAWAHSTPPDFVRLFRVSPDGFSALSSFSVATSLSGPSAWIDVDNDGLLDFIGQHSDGSRGYFRNRGGFQFTFLGDPFRAANTGSGIAIADADGNGALDVLTPGGLWMNAAITPNFPPGIPPNLRASFANDQLTLEWDAAFDLNQPQGLTYNVRVGTRPGASDVLSAESLPSGCRLLPKPGNAGLRASLTIARAPAETYFWSVQAVDSSYVGGPFAPEQRFFIDRPGNLPPVIALAAPALAPEDALGSFELTITDDRTLPILAQVEVTSLSPELLASSDISVAIEGGRQIVRFRGATNSFGSGRMEIRVRDAAGAEAAIVAPFTITPVNDAPTVSAIPAQQIDSPFDPITVAFAISDVDDPAENLTLHAQSQSQALLRNEDIHFGGAGSARTVELSSRSAQSGITTVTITARDPAGASGSSAFALTVTNLNFKVEPIDFGSIGPIAMSWGDINNDGWLDLAAGIVNTLIFTNGPAGLKQSALYQGSSSLDWGDYNRDGHLDLLLSGNGLFRGVYTNDAAGAFALVTPLLQLGGLSQFTDLNNDGRLDVVLTGPANNGGDRVQIYTTTRDGFVQQSIPVAFGVRPMLEDFNTDGEVDLHVVRSVNAVWRNMIMTQRASVFTERVFPWADAQLLAWSDFTNDGRPDAVVLHTNGNVQLYRGTAAGFDASILLVVGDGGGVITTGDFDSDGFCDLVMALRAGTFLVRNLAGSAFAALPAPFLNGRYLDGQPADFNNDGRLDILLTKSPFHDRGAYLHRNTFLPRNTPPNPLSNVRAKNTPDGLLIEWNQGSDPNQSGGLTYNVAAGTAPARWDILDPASNPNGSRKIPQRGNAGWQLAKLIKGIPTGTKVFFTAQAVDNSFAGSPFAETQSIVIITPPRLAIEPTANGLFSFTITGEIGATYTLEASSNLQSWSPFWTWTATSSESRFTLPIGSPFLFVRATGR